MESLNMVPNLDMVDLKSKKINKRNKRKNNMATKYLLDKTNPYKDIYVDIHGNKWCRIDDENMPMNEKIVEKIFKLFQASWEKKINKIKDAAHEYFENTRKDVYDIIINAINNDKSDESIIQSISRYFELNEVFDPNDLDLGEVVSNLKPEENKESEKIVESDEYRKELNEKHLKQVLTQESVKNTCKRLAEQIAKNCPFIKEGQKISFTVQVNI